MKSRDTTADGAKPEYNEVIIHVLECQGLRAADRKLIGKSTSDPYVVVKDVKGLIGSDRRTAIIKKALNPKWDGNSSTGCGPRAVFPYHFNFKLSEFKFVVFDHDEMTDDDLLGKVKIPIRLFYNIAPDGTNFRTVHQTFPLISGRSYKWSACHGKSLGNIRLQISIRFNIPMAIPNTLIPLNTPQFHVALGWDFGKNKHPIDLDASVAGLAHDNSLVDYCAFSRLQAFSGQMRHSGDDRTGEGGGDDETIVINATAPEFSKVDRFLILINAYSGESLDRVKHAYVRIVFNGVTQTFFTFDHIPSCTGLVFGQILRLNGVWHFITACKPANGRTMMDSLPGATEICTHQQMHHLPQTVMWNLQLPSTLQVGQTYNGVVNGQTVPVTVPETYQPGRAMDVEVAMPANVQLDEAGGQLLRSAVTALATESSATRERDVKDLSLAEMCAALERLNLGHVTSAFRDNGIDGAFFSQLSDEDLEQQLGLKPLQIRNIRKNLG